MEPSTPFFWPLGAHGSRTTSLVGGGGVSPALVLTLGAHKNSESPCPCPFNLVDGSRCGHILCDPNACSGLFLQRLEGHTATSVR